METPSKGAQKPTGFGIRQRSGSVGREGNCRQWRITGRGGAVHSSAGSDDDDDDDDD